MCTLDHIGSSKANLILGSRVKASTFAVVAQAVLQDHQSSQQHEEEQERLVWQQEGIKTWAATVAHRIVEQLRDGEGSPLPSQTMSDMHCNLTAHLSKSCTTQAMFDKRRNKAVAARELLQFVMDLGFTTTQASGLLKNYGGRQAATAPRILAVVDQLQQIIGGSKRKAVSALGRNQRLISIRPDALAERFEYMQQISGASLAQAATMVGRQAQILASSETSLEASLRGLFGACKHRPSAYSNQGPGAPNSVALEAVWRVYTHLRAYASASTKV